MSTGHYRDRLDDQPIETELVSDELLHGGFRDFKVATLRHARLAGEGMIGPVRREYLHTGSVVVVIPYDPVLDSIVVIRQFRLAAALKTECGAALELPAGMVDAGESIEAAARRELTEETGLVPQAVEDCFRMLAAPGLTDEHATIFLALVDASNLATSAGNADEDEDIRPILAKVDDLVAAVDDRRVENGYLIACTHWFARLGRSRAQALLGTLDGPED